MGTNSELVAEFHLRCCKMFDHSFVTQPKDQIRSCNRSHSPIGFGKRCKPGGTELD